MGAVRSLEDGGSAAKIIADSANSFGDRVTSFQVRFHRFVLAEFNTHAVFDRNSASSRAIPAGTQLRRYDVDPAWPISWPAEQKGMSGGSELTGNDLEDARALFSDVKSYTQQAVSQYLQGHPEPEHRLHKSLLNRLLEPLQWHTALVTASSYGNFFEQRVSPAAQPELRVVAAMMQELYNSNEPVVLKRGEWHLPYIRSGPEFSGVDRENVQGLRIGESGEYDVRHISAARCARVSYLTQEGQRDYTKDVELYASLVENGHWSPLGHVCTPWPNGGQHYSPVLDPDTGRRLVDCRLPRLGKFVGWQQWRHIVEGQMGYVSYR